MSFKRIVTVASLLVSISHGPLMHAGPQSNEAGPSTVKEIPDNLLPLFNRQDPTVLSTLAGNAVSTPEEAERKALQWKLESGGLLAEESTRVVGLLRVGVAVPGFAQTGDLVWVVRCFRMLGGVTQEIWVSSTTGGIRAMLPAVSTRPREP